MTEREERQLKAMLEQLRLFQHGEVDLWSLIASLESLMNALEEAPEPWLSDFRKHWGVLEEVYAVAVDEERPPDDPDDRRLIAKATSALQSQIESGYAP